ncbi:hypothetical protein NKG94_45795 [Micromonospora sp. M12]
MRSVQGRFGEIVLADTNLPEITEKRLLKPLTDEGRAAIDNAFAAVKGNREVWDALLLGAQYGDAGIGSDAAAFRKLYPFSPALVATLVALSQALQRERTALKVMTELLVDRRDTLRVNDLIGWPPSSTPGAARRAARPAQAQAALPSRPHPLHPEAAPHPAQPQRHHRRSGGWTPSVPARRQAGQDGAARRAGPGSAGPAQPHRRQAARAELRLDHLADPRLRAADRAQPAQPGRRRRRRAAPHQDPDPVVSLSCTPSTTTSCSTWSPRTRPPPPASGSSSSGSWSPPRWGSPAPRGSSVSCCIPDWRGRRHTVQVKFGNVRDPDTMPVSALIATGEAWRVIIDYPFDPQGYERVADRARIERLERGSRTVFWLPYFLTDELMGKVGQLARINYLLGNGTGDRLNSLAADWPSPTGSRAGSTSSSARPNCAAR